MISSGAKVKVAFGVKLKVTGVDPQPHQLELRLPTTKQPKPSRPSNNPSIEPTFRLNFFEKTTNSCWPQINSGVLMLSLSFSAVFFCDCSPYTNGLNKLMDSTACVEVYVWKQITLDSTLRFVTKVEKNDMKIKLAYER